MRVSEASGREKGMRILIVDDEANIGNGLARIIRTGFGKPCKIQVYTNAEDALNASKAFHPDLVITDIVMPGMDGLAMIEAYKKQSPATAIIILSGYDHFSYVQKALRMGVMDYLLKPVDSEQLFAQLYRIYEQLPKSYQQIHPAAFPHLPFFEKNIHDPSYPASLKRTVIYIEQNYMKELTLQDIACEMMLSPNYLSSLINTHLGHSFNYLLDYIRLEKALLLIASEPDMTNAELSYLVGYSSERRLYHAFQTRLGFTPGWYRDICLTRRRSNHDGNT